MGYEMVMKKPIDPIKGTLVYNNYVDKLYDRGEGKGTDLEVKNLVYDEGGDLICENTSYHRFPNVGGWGGPAPVKIKVEYPEREPDYVVESYISPVQNALYRLTGDTNESHINPEAALKQEPKGVFMQGLSSFWICLPYGNQSGDSGRTGENETNLCADESKSVSGHTGRTSGLESCRQKNRI